MSKINVPTELGFGMTYREIIKIQSRILRFLRAPTIKFYLWLVSYENRAKEGTTNIKEIAEQLVAARIILTQFEQALDKHHSMLYMDQVKLARVEAELDNSFPRCYVCDDIFLSNKFRSFILRTQWVIDKMNRGTLK